MEHENQYLQALAPKYDCLLFDLDDTLYPQSSGLSKQCANNIEEYMIQKLGIDEAQVPEMNRLLYKSYGTSMAGLHAIGYEFDDDDYHSYVHGRLPYQNLKTDHVLRSLLLSLPIRKVIFSNADKAHIAKSLSILGLEDCFEMVVCFDTLNPSTVTEGTKISDGIKKARKDAVFDAGSELPETPIVCKPFENAFQQAFKIANINPQRTLFFEDSIRNIETGKQLGMETVLVGSRQRQKGVDYAVESMHNIREAIPDLWEIHEKSEEKSYSAKMPIETSITA